MAIRCPKCGEKTDVRSTRTFVNGTARRRRICSALACGTRITTLEIPLATNERVIRNPTIVSMDDLVKHLRFLAAPLLRTISPNDVLQALLGADAVLPPDDDAADESD